LSYSLVEVVMGRVGGVLGIVLAAAAVVRADGGAATRPAVVIIAHRGASADAPENTLAAFRLGYEQGADAVELDVFLSADGHPVVIHDANTKRTAGVDKRVAAQTLAELRALDAGDFGAWKGKGFKGERIPTLDEALALVPAGRRMFIEIKAGPEAVPAVDAALKRWAGDDAGGGRATIIAFRLEVLTAAKKSAPGRPAYWLRRYDRDKKTNEYPRVDDLIRQAKEAGVDGLSFDQAFPLDAAAVARVKAAGLSCHVWTVDDPAKARAFVAAGVDSITTNRPGALRRELQAGQ